VNDVSFRSIDRYVFDERLDDPSVLYLIQFTEGDV
jgi:hypothetical protein